MNRPHVVCLDLVTTWEVSGLIKTERGRSFGKTARATARRVRKQPLVKDGSWPIPGLPDVRRKPT